MSLAYLWQREQSSLLRNMISDGVCAILVKVASIGNTCSQVHLLNIIIIILLLCFIISIGMHACCSLNNSKLMIDVCMCLCVNMK